MCKLLPKKRAGFLYCGIMKPDGREQTIDPRRFFSAAVLIVLQSVLNACAVGPSFKEPSFHPPDRFTAEPLPEQTVSVSTQHGVTQSFVVGQDIPEKWWELFHSPAINRAVAEAIQNNPGLDASRYALRRAQEMARAQYAGLLPSISGVFGRQSGDFPQADNGLGNVMYAYGYYDAHLNLSYNFDVWGRTRRSIEQATAQADAKNAELLAIRLILTGNVVSTAINIATLGAKIEVQKRLIECARDYLTMVRSQFRMGAANATDVALQESELARREAMLPELKAGLAEGRNALAAYLGTTPQDLRLSDLHLSELTLPTDLPVSLPSTLLEHRPDIIQAKANVRDATAGVGIAIANRLPQFMLSADLGSQAAMAGELMTPGNGLATLATLMATPVFQGGALYRRQKAAAAAMQESMKLWQATVLDAIKAVANVLTQLENDAVTLRAAADREQATQKALVLASTSFTLGGSSYIDVLVSEINHQEAVLGLLEARAGRLSDTSALFVALGGGWWNK